MRKTTKSPGEKVVKGEYDLLNIADSWLRVPLQDIGSVQNGFAFKSEFFDRTEGIPLIRIRDVTKEETEHRYRGEYLEEYVVRNGDILVGMDGDFRAANAALSRELGINVKTVAKWRKRDTLENRKTGPTEPSSTVLSADALHLHFSSGAIQ